MQMDDLSCCCKQSQKANLASFKKFRNVNEEARPTHTRGLRSGEIGDDCILRKSQQMFSVHLQ